MFTAGVGIRSRSYCNDCDARPIRVIVISIPDGPYRLLRTSLILYRTHFARPDGSLGGRVTQGSLELQCHATLTGTYECSHSL